jgi:hypothetical protein
MTSTRRLATLAALTVIGAVFAIVGGLFVIASAVVAH